MFNALGFENYKAQISLRDPKNKTKYIGTDENWDKAETAIIEASAEKGLETVVEYGEAAFYGPKLDFMVKDALGREWQLGTIQVDYNLPERFELEYTGADNQKHRPVMIHRNPLVQWKDLSRFLLNTVVEIFQFGLLQNKQLFYLSQRNIMIMLIKLCNY